MRIAKASSLSVKISKSRRIISDIDPKLNFFDRLKHDIFPEVICTKNKVDDTSSEKEIFMDLKIDPSGFTGSVKDLVNYISNSIKCPPDRDVKVFIGIYNRTAKTFILPPTSNTVNRVICLFLNLNDKQESIHLDPNQRYINRNGQESIGNPSIPEEKLRIRSDSYIILGSIKQADFCIKISGNVKSKIIEMDQNNGKTYEKSSIRYLGYQRIIVIIDYLLAERFMIKLNQKAEEIVPKITANQFSKKKDIQEQMNRAKQLLSKNEDIVEIDREITNYFREKNDKHQGSYDKDDSKDVLDEMNKIKSNFINSKTKKDISISSPVHVKNNDIDKEVLDELKKIKSKGKNKDIQK